MTNVFAGRTRMARPDTSKSSSARMPSPGCGPSSPSTRRRSGPALGGTRFYPYASEDAALADVLNLSRAMAYKNALAGLDLGGGKAVIIGDPAELKSEALLRAYGRFVQSLNGRYITACDIGTYSEDMDVVARECSLRHRTDGAQRRGRRLLGADRLRRIPGDAGGRRACLGQHQPGRQDSGRRGRRQGRPPAG